MRFTSFLNDPRSAIIQDMNVNLDIINSTDGVVSHSVVNVSSQLANNVAAAHLFTSPLAIPALKLGVPITLVRKLTCRPVIDGSSRTGTHYIIFECWLASSTFVYLAIAYDASSSATPASLTVEFYAPSYSYSAASGFTWPESDYFKCLTMGFTVALSQTGCVMVRPVLRLGALEYAFPATLLAKELSTANIYFPDMLFKIYTPETHKHVSLSILGGE